MLGLGSGAKPVPSRDGPPEVASTGSGLDMGASCWPVCGMTSPLTLPLPAWQSAPQMSHLFTFLTLTLLLFLYQCNSSDLSRSNSLSVVGTLRQRIYILRHKIGFIQKRLHHLVLDLNRVRTNLVHVRMMMETCEANNSISRWEYFAAVERSLFKELCMLKTERLEKEQSLSLMRIEMQSCINELSLYTTSTITS